MSPSSTFSAFLREAAASTPDRVIYRFFNAAGLATSTLTLGALSHVSAQLGRRVAAAQREIPHAASSPILLCTGPGREQPLGLFGVWAAGATAVPVYPPGPVGAQAAVATLVGIAKASGARLLLASAAIGEALTGPLRQALGDDAPTLITLEEFWPDGAEASDVPPNAGPEQAALVLYTSGSTGAPKGAVITQAGFLSNLRAMVKCCVPGGTRRVCTWLPHAHIAGIYTRLLPLVSGGEAAVLPPESFSRHPALWIEMIHRERSTLSAAPDFAYSLVARSVNDQILAGLDLSCWTMVISGGERVRPDTVDRFFVRLARTGLRPEALHPYYGMTESLCNAIPQKAPPLRLKGSKQGLFHGRLRAPENAEDVQELLGNGPALGDGTEIIVAHPTSRWRCQPGQVGEIWTRGPAITPGYHRDAEHTESLVRARLDDGDGPWFRTGDLGFIHDGQVFITGRCKELLIVRGKNHYPQDVETTALTATGLPEGTAVAFTVIHDDEEALGLALELEPRDERVDQVVRSARRAIATRHGLMIAQLYLLAPGSLPRTATQKIAREECRLRAASGDWDGFKAATARRRHTGSTVPSAVAGLSGAPLSAAILAGLVQILSDGEGGKLEEADFDRPFNELGLGSLEVARVVMALRHLTGVEPPFALLFDGTTVRGVANHLSALVEGRERPPSELADWRRDLRTLAASLPDKLPPRREEGGAILLTGATGYLGSYLLASLLAQGDAEVRCLVRATTEATGLARLQAALAAGPGWNEKWRDRLVAVPGDLQAHHLGLSNERWADLTEEAAVLIHNAANVNFVAPYSVLQPTNVAPVHALIELAISGGACKTVHLISTLAVFNATFRREQRLIHGFDRLLKPDHLYSGYAQSKWVAEACFRAASARGIPMRIHRPGLITGAADTGHTNTDDFLCRFILGCVALAAYPDVEVELDLVAVDDVADGIAAAVYAPAGTGGTCGETYHWSNPRPVLVAELMQVYRDRGYPLRAIPLPDWLGLLRSGLAAHNPLFPVHPFLLEVPEGSEETILEFMDGLPHTVDRREAEALRAAAGLSERVVDPAAMHRMAAWLEAKGALRHSDKSPRHLGGNP